MIDELLRTLPPNLARSGEDGPAFAEPWHAAVLALTVQLARRGLFSWSDWVSRFSAEVARDPQRADESVEQAYYRQWFAALEPLLRDHGIGTAEIDETQEHWRRSYLHTPHGHPISFSRAWQSDPDGSGEASHHHHHHHGHGTRIAQPVAVIPPLLPGTPDADGIG